jgi:hypothetical protein
MRTSGGIIGNGQGRGQIPVRFGLENHQDATMGTRSQSGGSGRTSMRFRELGGILSTDHNGGDNQFGPTVIGEKNLLRSASCSLRLSLELEFVRREQNHGLVCENATCQQKVCDGKQHYPAN